jgi:molecular chaperone GrpE
MNTDHTPPADAPGQNTEEASAQTPVDMPVAEPESDILSSVDLTIAAQLSEARKEITTLKDQLLRKAAEFENFRRRNEERQADLVRYGNERLITELLPVIDDFQRSLKAGREHPDFEPFYTGVEMLSSKLLRVLEARGLKPIHAAGEPFNVDYHDAMLQIPVEGVPPGTIIDDIETGYMLHDKVIRHSKVTVATEKPEG